MNTNMTTSTMPSRCLLAAAAAIACLALAVHAHDTGFEHSERAIFFVRTDAGWTLQYRVHQLPEEALAEMARMDADGNGKITDDEKQTWFTRRARELAAHLTCTAKGHDQELALTPAGFRLAYPLTQTYTFTIATATDTLVIQDTNFAHKAGRLMILHTRDIEVKLIDVPDATHVEAVKIEVRRVHPPTE